MKYLSTAALGILAASSAFAHEGMHMHPHGAEVSISSVIIALSVAALVGAYIAYRRGR